MVKIGMLIADRYEVLEKTGTGGMSVVYRAKDHKLNRTVAIKVLKQEFSDNANFVSKFRVEAQAAALPAAEKAKHWTLKRGWKLVQGAVPALTVEEYAKLEKTHLCCTAAAVSDNREPLLPHWHVEGS